MEDLSEEKIRRNCPHCDPNSFALKHPLQETGGFWIVCDVHPLVEGHILIIPKKHLSCAGAYSDLTFQEFYKLFTTFSEFLTKSYDSAASFEHGKVGQTVFHSHVHLMPFSGKASEIVPEGKKYLKPLKTIKELKDVFLKDEQYLFLSLGNKMWTVEPSLGALRFFRDRFAKALAKEEQPRVFREGE